MTSAPAAPNSESPAMALEDLASVTNLTLPDPSDDRLPDEAFRQQIDAAWLACDRFDLQTEIWRGRILRTVRDREKHQGDTRGGGFLNWLRDRDISKSQAYRAIELADSADALLGQEDLSPSTLNHFSKQAFVEAAKSPTEVQQMVVSAASQGERIGRQAVRQLSDEWSAMTSDLIPETLRLKTADRSIPPRYVAPLVRELEKLPERHQAAICEEVEDSPDVDTLKRATVQARCLARYLESSAQSGSLNRDDLDLEQALEEALRIGSLHLVSELVDRAARLEQSAVKTYTLWRRVKDLGDRLYVDSGASTPHLRSLLDSLSTLSGNCLEVTLAGQGDRLIRLKLSLEESEPVE